MYLYLSLPLIVSDDGLSPVRHRAIMWTNQCLVNTGWYELSEWDLQSEPDNMISTHYGRMKYDASIYWDQDKMAAILQTTFWDASWWMEIIYSFKFHRNLFPMVHSQYASIGSDNGLLLIKSQSIFWSNDDLVYWCICASLGLSELIHFGCIKLDALTLMLHHLMSFLWKLHCILGKTCHVDL